MPSAIRRVHWRVAKGLVIAMLALAASVAAGCGSSGSSSSNAAADQTSTGSSGASSSGGRPTIYMIGSVANNTFWAAVKRGFEDGGRDLGLHAVYSAPDVHSSSEAIPLVKSAIASHPAGIAINYTDKSLQKPVLDALGSGVHVVLYNNRLFQAVNNQQDTATTDPRITSLSYVGEDTELNARDLATEFAKHLKPGATVVVVDPVPGVLTLALRRKGIESVLQPKGIKVEYLPAALDEGKNFSTIGSYVQGHSGLGGIIGLGGPTANPAARYVKQNNLHLPVAGFDVDAETAAALRDGSMVAATDQQPYLQGYLAAVNLNSIINKHLFPVTVNTGSYIVTKSNIDTVQQALEAHTG